MLGTETLLNDLFELLRVVAESVGLVACELCHFVVRFLMLHLLVRADSLYMVKLLEPVGDLLDVLANLYHLRVDIPSLIGQLLRVFSFFHHPLIVKNLDRVRAKKGLPSD